MCVYHYKICIDPLGSIIYEKLDSHFEGNYICPPGLEPPDPEIVNESSSCFGLPTPCDP